MPTPQTDQARQVSHSPGPWEIHGDITRQNYYIHGANRICDIVKPSGFYRSPAETEANARLIAAAPALLEALKKLRDECQASRRYIVISDDDGYEAYNETARAVVKADAALARATNRENGA